MSDFKTVLLTKFIGCLIQLVNLQLFCTVTGVVGMAAAIESIKDQNTVLQMELDAINARAANRWSTQDQKIWTLQLQIDNPTITVPDSDAIVGSRNLP